MVGKASNKCDNHRRPSETLFKTGISWQTTLPDAAHRQPYKWLLVLVHGSLRDI